MLVSSSNHAGARRGDFDLSGAGSKKENVLTQLFPSTFGVVVHATHKVLDLLAEFCRSHREVQDLLLTALQAISRRHCILKSDKLASNRDVVAGSGVDPQSGLLARTKECGADPNVSRSFLDRHLKIVAHSHAQPIHADTLRFLPEQSELSPTLFRILDHPGDAHQSAKPNMLALYYIFYKPVKISGKNSQLMFFPADIELYEAIKGPSLLGDFCQLPRVLQRMDDIHGLRDFLSLV